MLLISADSVLYRNSKGKDLDTQMGLECRPDCRQRFPDCESFCKRKECPKVPANIKGLQPIWFFAAFNAIAIGTIRVTFFIAYLEIFGPKRWLRISAYSGVTFTALYHITIAIVVFVLTTPARDKTWFSATTTVNYQRFLALLVPACVVAFAVDLWILTLPLIAVLKLQMPTRRKIGICLIFMTGIL